ncbi:type I-E CRISPR-associated protein Cse1/CasA [Roseibacillus persicicus]|uniref:type I-E CRISPR-associated protein Cse1/CasA n=1 Tax=Roseibacillus persicicus TaxID=454148 RepID=UPI00280CFE18|nr:type I-E CRISPR-associated protein Cse1/CasA [Roseibacillus persicicus]MDQ8189675.1 type I-E CRISPR-associated protein Cse1/CasA [Roseibacillus persicicus]
MNNFNLIDQPWIPIRWLNSATDNPTLVSLHDAFTRAHEIADLDCLPHERIALTRLLVCIAHAALGIPGDAEDWLDIDFGHDLQSTAPSYLQREDIHPHFNLLGDGPRFLQSRAKFSSTDVGYPLSKISFHLSSGNNPKLLDHWGEDPRPWTESAAALTLLCLQNFFVGGSMASKVKGNGPALNNLQMLLLGGNLAQTILRNCLDAEVLESSGNGLGSPSWESKADTQLLSRLSPTPCDLWLTDDLKRIYIDNGTQQPKYPAYRDPYATIEPLKDNKDRLLRAKPSQGIWRDLPLLTNINKAKGQNAALNLQAFNARNEAEETTQLWVGELIKGEKATIKDNVESTFTIPAQLFTDEGRNVYSQGIKHAEAVSMNLWGAINEYGRQLGQKKRSSGEGQKHYWHTLDQEHRKLIAMSATPVNYLTQIGSEHANDPWTLSVRQAARQAYDAVCPRTTPRQIQAYTAGIKPLLRALFPKEKPPKGAKPQSTQANLNL